MVVVFLLLGDFFLVPCVFLNVLLKKNIAPCEVRKMLPVFALMFHTHGVLGSLHSGYRDLILLHHIFPGGRKEERKKERKGKGRKGKKREGKGRKEKGRKGECSLVEKHLSRSPECQS